ncbi:hypothetical protein ACIQC7_27870 [Kitasatospora sp. NPDC088556]|uniref:hypothetical protein n=1 Tax=Kitasatospora sp. NPDC088556 TaxID=3364076 RepID=UPI0037F61C74
MTTDQAAARAAMIAIMRRTFRLTDTTAGRLVDIGLAAERTGQRAWPAINAAVNEAADRGEDWAVEALHASTN